MQTLELESAPPPVAVPFALICWTSHRLQIQPEGKALSARFGASYAEYKAKVRMWV